MLRKLFKKIEQILIIVYILAFQQGEIKKLN
jgi:hypothetical protein